MTVTQSGPDATFSVVGDYNDVGGDQTNITNVHKLQDVIEIGMFTFKLCQ